MRIRSPGAILALLTLLNLLNYLDRFLLAAVGPAVQKDLELGDFQFGLVLNAFMLGYFATSPLFGMLGDRYRRKGLIAAGVATWSLATAASGMTRAFGSLLGARVAVGVGEASYATLAPTIIDDLAPPAAKNRYLAVFYVAIPVGSACGYLLGGHLEHAFGWRSAFFVVGVPGLLAAAAALLIVEPLRTAVAKAREEGAVRTLAALPLYRDTVIGYTAFTFALGGFAAWAPKYLVGHLGMDLQTADFWFGAVLVVAGLLATFVGGALADRWPGADRARANLRMCAVTAAIAVPFAAACLLMRSPAGFFVAVFATEFALFLSTSPINVAILGSAPESLRASAMAISIFAIHLFGDMISPPLIGLVSDRSDLRTGMWMIPVAIAAAAVVWWRGSRLPANGVVESLAA